MGLGGRRIHGSSGITVGVIRVRGRSLTSSVIGFGKRSIQGPVYYCMCIQDPEDELNQLNHGNWQVKYPGPRGKTRIQGPGEELDQLKYGNKWEEDPGPWSLSVSRARVRSWTSSFTGISGRSIQGPWVLGVSQGPGEEYPGPGELGVSQGPGEELDQLNHGTP